METIFPLIISAIIGYLLGSIPFGLILTKLGGYGDIRDIGSGNIGATNVLRTGNKKLAIATLLLDGLKGVVAILIVKIIFTVKISALPVAENLLRCSVINCIGNCPCLNEAGEILNSQLIQTVAPNFLVMLTAALFALLGHVFPVWLKFKGGKGVATGLGILLVLSWPVGLAAAGTWAITFSLSRISSLSALMAVSLSPVFAYLFTGDAKLMILCAVMSMIIIAKHHTNIKRLLKGDEPKIGKKK